MQSSIWLNRHFNNLTKFFAQPYPFYYQGKFLWIVAGLLFVVTLLFSYFFKPFEVYLPEHKMNFFLISVIHALNPVLIIAIFSLVKISSKTEENWNVRKEMLLIISFLFLVGLAQFTVRDIIYNNPNNWSFRYLYEEVRNTFLVGTLFAILFTSLNFNRLNARNTKKANAINFSNVALTTNNQVVFIETPLKSESFSLNVESLLFAKADGNYIELYIKQQKIDKLIKRITLKEVESILKPYSNIIKTHRSYLVNIHHVNKVFGNAQGYKLRLNNYSEKIPVSRNMIDRFDAIANRS